ncbi:MAG: tetratricopeptide repeat protein [Planctomycetota bacterium]
MSSRRRNRPLPPAAPRPAPLPVPPPEPFGGAAWSTGLVAAALAILAATMAVYGRTAGHEFLSLDDPDYVTGNPWVRGGLSRASVAWAITHSYAANWHPLTWLSHMLDVELFGMDPGSPHLVNAALHIASTALLFLALRAMTREPWPSLLVAALFALHPLHVESVAWVSERKDVLSTAFGMGTLLAYAGYARRPGLGRYAAVFVLLALGLLAKSMLVTLPVLLLLLDAWPLRRKEPIARLVLEKLPLLALSLAISVKTVVSQGAAGAVSTTEVFTVPVRILNALSSYLLYLGQTVWPAGLACFYPHPAIVAPESRALLATGLAGAAVLAGVTAAALLGRRRWPYLLVGWLWYLGTLVPVIGLVQVGEQARADRYTYLPLIGIFLALAGALADLGARRPAVRRGVAAGAGIVLAALTGLTWRQVGVWRDSESLWAHALEVTDRNYHAFDHLGTHVASRDLPRATKLFEEASAIKPYDTAILVNLGIAYAHGGRTDEAIAKFEAALVRSPNLAGAHFNLGISLVARGDLEAAATHFRAAIRIRPEDVEPFLALGNLHARRGEWERARGCAEDALRMWPNSVPALYQHGVALANLGDLLAAGRRFTQVVEKEPTHVPAHIDLGRVALLRGDGAGAIAEFRRALELDPSLPRPAGELALLLATHPDPRLRDAAEARRWAEHAAKATGHREPFYLEVLAATCAEAGKYADAVQWQLQALALAPPAQAAGLRERLTLYEGGQPWRRAIGR